VTLNESIGKPKSPVRPGVLVEGGEDFSDGESVGVERLGLSGEVPVIIEYEKPGLNAGWANTVWIDVVRVSTTGAHEAIPQAPPRLHGRPRIVARRQRVESNQQRG
jgi:hypothetical protein